MQHKLQTNLRPQPRIPGVSRVVVVTHSFPTPAQPYRGKSNLEMLRCLNELVDVQVVCPFSRYPTWLQPKWHKPPDPEFAPDGVHASYLEYPAVPLLTRAFNGISCARYAEPLVRDLQPDVILNYWIYPVGFAAVRLGRRLNVPVVVGSIGSDLHRIPDPVSRFLSGWTVRNADYVITKSESLRQHAIRLGAQPGHVRAIHNGCDSEIFTIRSVSDARAALSVAQDARLILYIGRLDVRKGVSELAEAFIRLAVEDPRLRLVYVGNGPDDTMIRKIAQSHPAGDRITIVGRLDPPAIAQWLAACNVLALPSYNEGCPNVILEALSCGRPVVASNVGGIPEIMNPQCGRLVPPRDVPGLAGALRETIDRTWDERSLARQFRRDFKTMAKEVLEVCEAAARRPLATRTANQIGALA